MKYAELSKFMEKYSYNLKKYINFLQFIKMDEKLFPI